MSYTNLFKQKYALFGKDWVRRIDPDDLKVFVGIGLEANEHGRQGGKALARKRGSRYMSEIGRRGAIMSNIKKAFIKAVREENERELGVGFDY